MTGEQKREGFPDDCAVLPKDQLLIEAASHGCARIQAHFTYLASDLFQIESDSPFSGLRYGYFECLPELSEEYWYVRDSNITRKCQKEAKALLRELYRVALLFEEQRKNLQKILLDAIEQGNEYYSTLGTTNTEMDEAFGVDLKGHVRKIRADELAKFKDTRSFEERRDFFILNRIASQCYFTFKTPIRRPVLAQLVERHFEVKLQCSDPVEQEISRRREETRKGGQG